MVASRLSPQCLLNCYKLLGSDPPHGRGFPVKLVLYVVERRSVSFPLLRETMGTPGLGRESLMVRFPCDEARHAHPAEHGNRNRGLHQSGCNDYPRHRAV